MDEFVGLDFETYASTDLRKHGLDRYVNCDDFQPLIAVVVVGPGKNSLISYHLDFIKNYNNDFELLKELLDGRKIAAHNAGFEQAVLEWMGIGVKTEDFIDTAVLARAAGAAGKLEAAGPQLLGVDKLEAGLDLIKLFSIPGKYQEVNGSTAFDSTVVVDHPSEWVQFMEYCNVDAELSYRLAALLLPGTSHIELVNNAITMDMNTTGWHVDLPLVRNMHLRYQLNLEEAEQKFRTTTGAVDLNLSSHTQLTKWCADRGVRATSFDEAHVERLIKRLINRTNSSTIPSDKLLGYEEVLAMLRTKQELGGSSLKKLQVILDTVSEDGRLRDQYLHIGAGATYRTTGRGVQMQNLKRLNGEGDDMEELFDIAVMWDNGKLATNLRQVFTATDPSGQLIVGDFASVESRGLAWQAGEQWKLNSYARGEDLYKVQAGLIFGIPIHEVVKEQRQIGKVGELSCGYGAGPEAVREFASKMGVELSEGEASKLVSDWRAANPETVGYWQRLDTALHAALMSRVVQHVSIPRGYVTIQPVPAPESLRKQVGDPHLISLVIRMWVGSTEVLKRVIHGVRDTGRNIEYFKPSELKGGDLWRDTFTNPKTKRLQKYTVYGGKLAGLLTQSLCREVFFDSLREVSSRLTTYNVSNVRLVGQFHDEIVLDWSPGNATLDNVKVMLHDCMSTTRLPGFPLAAEIKSDYRYIK